jgi:RNA polymerase sigma-70 factor (ECF subfamily)
LRDPDAKDAWDRFVELYTPLLYTWAWRRGLQEADADDLVQDVLSTVVDKLPEFEYDPNRSFRAWLRTILLNKWRTQLRRRQPGPLQDGGANIPAPDNDPALDLAAAEYGQQLVCQALKLIQAEFQLPTWKACWEVVVGGRSATAVARELGMTVNAVYVAKCRVLARLRRELEGLLD